MSENTSDTSTGMPEAPSLADLGGATEAPAPAEQPQGGEQGDPEPAQQEGQPNQPPRQRMVPHEALHEARQETKREREERIKLEARFEEFRQAVTQRFQQPQQQPAEEPLPDINADPVAYFKAENERMKRELAEVRQPVAQQQQMAAFANHVKAQVNSFAANTPDYAEAYAFARQKWTEDAQAYGDDPAQAELLIAQRALQNRKNVGEAVYEFAKRKGYTGPASSNPPAPDMGAVQRGQAASRGVGSNGTPAGKTDMSGQRVLSMPLSELKGMSDADWKAALGGG